MTPNQRILRIREKLRKSQKEIEAVTGIRQNTLSEIENAAMKKGKRLGVSGRVKRLFNKHYGASIDWIENGGPEKDMLVKRESLPNQNASGLTNGELWKEFIKLQGKYEQLKESFTEIKEDFEQYRRRRETDCEEDGEITSKSKAHGHPLAQREEKPPGKKKQV